METHSNNDSTDYSVDSFQLWDEYWHEYWDESFGMNIAIFDLFLAFYILRVSLSAIQE